MKDFLMIIAAKKGRDDWMTVLLDGKSLSQQKIAELAALIKNHEALRARPPHLAALLIGEDPASAVSRIKACSMMKCRRASSAFS